MQKIIPHLWFDTQASEAAAFYTSAFGNSRITSTTTIEGTPSGNANIISVNLLGQTFILINAGPYFTINPSISFLVACESEEKVNRLCSKLAAGGSFLMPLDTYPFSERYAWIQDKYGVSWQIMHMGKRPIKQPITPTLMFVGNVCGKAEEAISFYTTVFKRTSVDSVLRYTKDEQPDKPGTIKHAGFTLEGQQFAAMDSAHAHNFSFNEAVSLLVHCDTQAEIDYYWNKLSAVPKAEQCGWLKDKYGVSWQISPTIMESMMRKGTREQVNRVTKAFLKMKKFDIAKLTEAYEGKT